MVSDAKSKRFFLKGFPRNALVFFSIALGEGRLIGDGASIHVVVGFSFVELGFGELTSGEFSDFEGDV